MVFNRPSETRAIPLYVPNQGTYSFIMSQNNLKKSAKPKWLKATETLCVDYKLLDIVGVSYWDGLLPMIILSLEFKLPQNFKTYYRL